MSIGVSGKHSALGANIGKFGGGGAGGGGGGGPDGSLLRIRLHGKRTSTGQSMYSTDGTLDMMPSVGQDRSIAPSSGSWNGGGWMMVMKATRGGTFQWGSSYWTGTIYSMKLLAHIVMTVMLSLKPLIDMLAQIFWQSFLT